MNIFHTVWAFMRLVVPVAGLLLLLVAGGLTPNRYLRRRFRLSAFLAVAYLALAAFTFVSPGDERIRDIANLVGALAVVNALVVAVINPFRDDRISDRFPSIVQDAIVVALFAVVATVLMREKFLTTSAVGAVVVGFALQDTLGNMFSGLAIQIEKPFHVGHWIATGAFEGRVEEVTWRATKIRTKDNNFVVIPNNVVSKDAIINYSEPTLPTRIAIDIGASYDHPPNDVKRVLLEAAAADAHVLKQPPPEVLLWDFAAYAITYRLRFWISDYALDQVVRDRVRTRIYYLFRRHSLQIPYAIQVEYQREDKPPATGEERAAGWEPALRGIELLAPLTPEERAALAGSGRDRVYGAGEVIVRQGDPGDSMFVVRHGEARILIAAEGGEREVATIGAGNYFGEMSLLTGEPRTATVVAVTDCQVLEIGHGAFRALLVAHPEVLDRVGQVVAARRVGLETARQAVGTTVAGGTDVGSSLFARIRKFFQLA